MMKGMLGFLLCSIASFAVAAVVVLAEENKEEFLRECPWLKQLTPLQWALRFFFILGFLIITIIAFAGVRGISNATTLVLIQSVCGVLFGPALWYVIGHFSRMREKLT